jgi:hypothetical protein
MALFGLVTAFIVLVFAELQGSEKTRGTTRAGFLLVALHAMGLTLSGVAAFTADLLEMMI